MNETEFAGDIADVSRDAKLDQKRLNAAQYRDKYFKLAKVQWSPKQLNFINQTAKFCFNRAGNQSGKSYSIGGLIAYTATGRYPSSFAGWRPKLRKDGAYSVVIWVLSTTGQMVRDGLQTILLGDVAGGQIGTGLIPKECIGAVNMSRGIAGAVDFVTIKRDDDTLAKIAFKTYEQGRAALQAEPVSLVVLDELLEDMDSFTELTARTTTTDGRIRMTATERLQSSPVALWFRENASEEIVTLSMSLDDAEHLTQAEKDTIKASYKSEAELLTRYYGLPFQGGGSVFATPIAEIMEKMDPATFPPYFKYLIGLDFSHFGRSETSSQFAAVFMAIDPATGVVRIFDAVRMRGIVEAHVARIKAAGGMSMRVAWPHDGNQGMATGDNIAALYKKAGLNMLSTHAQFESGGYSFESGIELMDSMLATGKLRVAKHLTEWRDEYLAYERDEDGQVIKRMDDLMSATRVGCMSLRHARVLDEYRESGGKIRVTGREWDIFRT